MNGKLFLKGKIEPEVTHAPPAVDNPNIAKTPEDDTTKHRTNGAPIDNNDVIMDRKSEERSASFFAQPGILAGMYLVLI